MKAATLAQSSGQRAVSWYSLVGCLGLNYWNVMRIAVLEDQERTEALCMAAVQQNGLTLELLPRWQCTEAVCMVAEWVIN